MSTGEKSVMWYVTRLIDFGKGAAIPEFDDLTLGEIRDRIVDAAVREANQ